MIPLLVPDLRLALATLYSLPCPQSPDGKFQHSSSQAHDYLLQFQARNPRRNLYSKLQNQKQQPQQTTGNSNDVGSTWLTCIAILSSLSTSTSDHSGPSTKNVHFTEALFAAQTLVHRLRRTKLAEAIDVEFEPTIVDCSAIASLPFPPDKILECYRSWTLQHYYGASNLSSFGILSQHVLNYRPTVNQQNTPTELEERIKGEISMLIIVSIMDSLTKSVDEQAQQQTEKRIVAEIRPLMKSLASALAVIAARTRYVPTSVPSPAPDTQPIVTTILGAISMIQPPVQQSQESVHNLSFTCLTALPEAVLTGSNSGGNGIGGAYGRLSLDPRCYTAVTTELKTQGTGQMCQSIQNMINFSHNPISSTLILQMCEAWAKYVPLPIDFVNATVPFVLHAWEQFRVSQETKATSEMKAAMVYWITIMESGSWSIDQVLTSSLVQSKEASRQPNKKKQSSRSKKRHQQFLEENSTNELLVSARKEVLHRGQVSYMMAQQTLAVLQELVIVELRRINQSNRFDQDEQEEFHGDGPVGAIAACANTCLPYILRAFVVHQDTNAIAMFISIGQVINQMCASPSRVVRSFGTESLYTLHEALVETLIDHRNTPLPADFLEVILNHFFQCSMNLAIQCGYPTGFFNDLGKSNDDDLESERNNVRDVLRTVSGIPSTTSGGDRDVLAPLTFATSSILLKLLQACAQPIRDALGSKSLFSEPALHAFSALAKPINSVASVFSKNVDTGMHDKNITIILNLALEIVSSAGRCLLLAFPAVSINEILPLSRLYDLAIASLAPTFSELCQTQAMEREVETTIKIAIEAAATSLIRLPELAGPSTLRQTRFDIRGAMRSPGGEDHVGVLALMRFANESDSLSCVFLKSKDSILIDLCELYKGLKEIEDQRGVGVFYGVGVLPKSRRILLGVICDLETFCGEKGQASGSIASILENSIASITSAGHQLESLGAESLYRICESTFDIAAFPPNTIYSLFDISNNVASQTLWLNVLHQAGNYGFLVSHNTNIDDASILQWNRLRAALFTLLKRSGNPDIPSSIINILISFITDECNATTIQCSAGPTSPSRLFHEDVVSEESIPPGIFIRVLAETFQRAILMKIPLSKLRNTFKVLYMTHDSVLRSLISECSMPIQKGSFFDPRPVIAETWLFCMNKIAATCGGKIDGQEAIGGEIDSASRQLLIETFVATISLLLYTSLEKTRQKRAKDPGMSLDGPQGLEMMKFFVNFFDLGLSMIRTAARKLTSIVPVPLGKDADETGIAIIGAALFRGCQGGLPPWAVECTPPVYQSLFKALDKNVATFGHALEISMNVRINKDFGSVEAGSLLSGKFFERMNDKAKLSFVNQAKEIANQDTTVSWRRMKTLIKQTCGGKKKDTDFKQRPAPTSWESLDRV